MCPFGILVLSPNFSTASDAFLFPRWNTLALRLPRRDNEHWRMTTANKITIARILLVPFFILAFVYYVDHGNEWFRLGALLCFALTALGDGLDGYVARRYNQRSELGAMLDPLADKLVLISAIILLSVDSRNYFVAIPRWLTVTIISRDGLLIIGWAVIHYTLGKVTVYPRLAGKLATVLQMATVLWTLLKWNHTVLPFLTVGAGLFTGISGLLYLYDGARQLNAHPSSAPIPRQ
jgi:cardiolipin synthase (CMP-forming)